MFYRELEGSAKRRDFTCANFFLFAFGEFCSVLCGVMLQLTTGRGVIACEAALLVSSLTRLKRCLILDAAVCGLLMRSMLPLEE
jgi:hypothetical protein